MLFFYIINGFFPHNDYQPNNQLFEMIMYFLTYLVHMDVKKIKFFYNKQHVVFFLKNVIFLFSLDLTCLRCCLICIVFKPNFGCLQMNFRTISCNNHS